MTKKELQKLMQAIYLAMMTQNCGFHPKEATHFLKRLFLIFRKPSTLLIPNRLDLRLLGLDAGMLIRRIHTRFE